MYNSGTGQGAYDCDEAAISRAALLELQALLAQPKVAAFTRKNYPGEPMYMLHQNQLMAEGMTPEARKALAMGRYAHAKKAKVGESIACPGCGKQMAKASYQHVFCKDKVPGRSTCKDFINNWFDPVRLQKALAFLDGKK